MLRLSPRTVHEYVSRGEIEGRIIGERWRFRRADLDAFFANAPARLNCENIPVIPAWLVGSNLNDLRGIPHLLVWSDERDGEIKEAVRLARYVDPQGSSAAQDHVG